MKTELGRQNQKKKYTIVEVEKNAVLFQNNNCFHHQCIYYRIKYFRWKVKIENLNDYYTSLLLE